WLRVLAGLPWLRRRSRAPRARAKSRPRNGRLHRLSRPCSGSRKSRAWTDRDRGEAERRIPRQRGDRPMRRDRRVVADRASGNDGRRSEMRILAVTLCSICLAVGGGAAAEQAPIEGANPMSKSEDVRTVAPAL